MIKFISKEDIPDYIDKNKFKEVVKIIIGATESAISAVETEFPIPTEDIKINHKYESKFNNIANLTNEIISEIKAYYDAQLQYLIYMTGIGKILKYNCKYLIKHSKQIFKDNYELELDELLIIISNKCDVLNTLKDRYSMMSNSCHIELVARAKRVL